MTEIPIEEEFGVIIDEFPNYEVTNYGRVFNRSTGREMALSRNQIGMLSVGLVKDGRQYRRAVRLLVARTFVPGESERNDTPIQLNGLQDDLRASNMMWRPRWFAWEYQHQFQDPPPYVNTGPVLDITNAVEYETTYDACVANGYLFKQFYISTLNGGHVIPTGDRFMFKNLSFMR